MKPTPLFRCLFCGHINPDSASFCMDCGSQLNLQPCNNCDAVDSRASTNCHKCGAQFASIWALAPEPDAVDAMPNDTASPALATDPVSPDSASASGETLLGNGVPTSERVAASARSLRGWLALATATTTFLAVVGVAGFTYFFQPEKLVHPESPTQVVVGLPSQTPTSAVATQIDGKVETTVLSTKPDIGNSNLENASVRASPPTAPAPATAASTSVMPFTSATNANPNVNAKVKTNDSYRQERPILKECAHAVATLGLCDPEPQQENR